MQSSGGVVNDMVIHSLHNSRLRVRLYYDRYLCDKMVIRYLWNLAHQKSAMASVGKIVWPQLKQLFISSLMKSSRFLDENSSFAATGWLVPIRSISNFVLCHLHSTPLHSTPLHSTPLHSTPLHSTPLHSTPLHSTPLHSTPLHSTPLHSTPDVALIILLISTSCSDCFVFCCHNIVGL